MQLDATFFGIHETKLDGQFRLPLPKDVTEAVHDSEKKGLRVVPAPTGKWLDIFLEADFAKYFKAFIERQDITAEERNAAIDGYFSRAELAGIDGMNRLTVPKNCRDIFKGSKAVVLQGRGRMLRLMPARLWAQMQEQSRQAAAKLMDKIDNSIFTYSDSSEKQEQF